MAKNVRALVASVALVACGGGNDTLFVKGNPGGGGSDAGPSAGSATSSGGSSGNASGNGGSSATGGRTATGGQGGSPQTDGSTSTGGTTAADGSADGSNGGAPDASVDSSAGGSGGAGGAGGRATGGRGGGGGPNTGGRAGTGGKGGTAGDGGALSPTPGIIACAGTTCTIAGTIPNVCCAGGLTSACLPSFPGCVQFGAPFACDDAADCDSGSICCRTLLGTANCAKTCTGNQTQLCRTNSECKLGECRPLSQSPAYSSCQ